MSAESAISGLLAFLKSVSASMMGSTYDLVEQADARLRAIRPPEVGNISYEVKRERPDFGRAPRPPKLPGIGPLGLPEAGTLQEVTPASARFTGEAPALDFPDFLYPALPAPPTFWGRAPAPEPLTVRPQTPALTVPEPPTLTVPTAVRADPVSGDPPDVPRLTPGAFSADLYGEYRHGLAASEIAAWSAWLADRRAGLAPAEQALVARLRGGLAGRERGLPETWETGRYDQALQGIAAGRRDAHRALDTAPSPATGLPDGAGIAARLEVELGALQATAQAAAQVMTDRATRETGHLQWAMAVASKTVDAALDLRAQEAGWRLKGWEIALDGAEATLGLAVKVLALKKREIEALARYNEAQVRRTQARVKIEKTKLAALNVTVASEKLKGDHNAHQLEIVQAATALTETRLDLYRAQIDVLTTDVAWRKLALQAYESDTAAYQLQVNSKRAEYDAVRAKIKGDLAAVEAKLGEVRIYEANLQAQSATAGALAAQSKALAGKNRETLALYNATASAKLEELRALDRLTQTALSAMAKGLTAEVSEQEMALGSQELKDRDALDRALRDLSADQITALNALAAHKISLEQAEARGKVITSGAETFGGIAKQAFAGMNAIGATQAEESGS